MPEFLSFFFWKYQRISGVCARNDELHRALRPRHPHHPGAVAAWWRPLSTGRMHQSCPGVAAGAPAADPPTQTHSRRPARRPCAQDRCTARAVVEVQIKHGWRTHVRMHMYARIHNWLARCGAGSCAPRHALVVTAGALPSPRRACMPQRRRRRPLQPRRAAAPSSDCGARLSVARCLNPLMTCRGVCSPTSAAPSSGGATRQERSRAWPKSGSHRMEHSRVATYSPMPLAQHAARRPACAGHARSGPMHAGCTVSAQRQAQQGGCGGVGRGRGSRERTVCVRPADL